MSSSLPALRCLTLNCWGLKYVSKLRSQRLRAIGDALADLTTTANPPFSFIALQECWVYEDFVYIQTRLRESRTLVHAQFFFSGALGSGLALFSAYPIREINTWPYSLNGSPLDVAGGDWFVGKGAVSIVVQPDFLNGQVIEVFNTHFHAKGGDDGPETSRAHRLAHAWELSKLIRASAERGRWIISMGDYNSLPQSLVMRVLREHAGLTDVWESAQEMDLEDFDAMRQSGGASSVRSLLDVFSPGDIELTTPRLAYATREENNPPSTPEEALHSRGVTADSPLNTWSAGKPLSTLAKRDKGKRLDYVLYRTPRGQLRGVQAKVVFTEPIPGLQCSYSDHFGVDATLIPTSDVLEHCRASSSNTMSEDVFDTVLHAMHTAVPRAARNSQRLLVGLAFAVVFLAALLTAPSWVPRIDSPTGGRVLAFVGILITVLVTWAGTTALYAGFIFGRWEDRALRRAIDELERWRDQVGTVRNSQDMS